MNAGAPALTAPVLLSTTYSNVVNWLVEILTRSEEGPIILTAAYRVAQFPLNARPIHTILYGI